MLNGALALLIRYILLTGGSALATAGIITAGGGETFCFDATATANAAAAGVAMALGGGASVSAGVAWRWWAKRRGGVT